MFLAFGLSMDAFAVSVSNGMCYKMNPLKNALSSGLAFGLFQGLMPLIGYLAGRSFSDVIESVDHWIALVLLSFIGGKMIVEAVKMRKEPEDCKTYRAFSFRTLTVQAIATSIDALAVGVSLGVMKANILLSVGVIALITFCCSFAGVFIGKKCGVLLQDKAEILGGVILILIGVNIFLEHVGPAIL